MIQQFAVDRGIVSVNTCPICLRRFPAFRLGTLAQETDRVARHIMADHPGSADRVQRIERGRSMGDDEPSRRR